MTSERAQFIESDIDDEGGKERSERQEIEYEGAQGASLREREV